MTPLTFSIMFQAITKPAMAGVRQLFGWMQNQLSAFGTAYNAHLQTLLRSSYRFGRMGGLIQGLVGYGIRRAGKAMVDMGLAIGSTLIGGVAAAEEFELQMAKVAAVVEGNTEQMAALRETALRTALDPASAFGATETAQALEALAQAGFNAEEAQAALKPTLDLTAASMGRLTTEQSAMLAVMATRTLGVQKRAGGLAGFMDQLTVATQRSNLGFEDLRTVFARIGATGIMMENTTVGALLAITTAGKNANKTGKETGQAIQSMSSALAMLNKEQGAMGLTMTKQKTEALGLLGLTPADLKDENKEWKSMVTILAMMSRQAEKLNKPTSEFSTILNTVFQKGAGQLAVLAQNMSDIKFPDGRILSGADALEELAKMIDLVGVDKINQTEETAKRFLATWAGVKKQLVNVWETFKIVLADTVLPLLSQAVRMLNAFLRVAVNLLRNNVVLRMTFFGVGAALSALLIVMGALTTVVGMATIAVAMFCGSLAATAQIAAETDAILSVLTVTAGFFQATIFPLAAMALPYLIAGLVLMIPLLAFVVGIFAAWQMNAGGLATTLTTKIDDITNAMRALYDFWTTGRTSLDIGNRLFYQTPMLGRFVVMILNLKYRLEQLWKGFKEGLEPSLRTIGPHLRRTFDNFKDALWIVAKLLGLSTDLGKARGWRQFGNVLGTVLGILIQVGGVMFEIITTLQALGLSLWGVFGWIGRVLWITLVEPWFFIPRLIYAALTEGLAGVVDLVKSHFQDLRDLFPFSEPKDASSPLYGLGLAGAAILRNIASGMIGFAPTFGSMVAAALTAAFTPGPGAPPTVTGMPAAPGGIPGVAAPVGGGVTVTIGQMVFQAAELTPEQAEKFAKVIAEKIADELQRQMSASVA